MTAEEVRQENESLREQVRWQQEKINWLEERLLLFQQQEILREELQHQVELLKDQVQALQDQLKKDSHNSHLPPSSDRFHRQAKSLRQKSGKQVIDLPIKRVLVIEHQAQQKCCPSCQQISSAAFPENVSAPVQYGAAFGAVGVYLVHQQLVPYERACGVMQDLLGPSMSEKTLPSLVQRCAEHLCPVEEQIKAALARAAVLHQDETGLYVAGKRHWMHVSATEQLTHYAVHVKRGHETLDAIGILKDFHGVSVHDGWQSYWRYACEHGLCNLHHLRELIFLYEVRQQAWAAQMKDLLLDMKAALDQTRAEGRKALHSLEVQDWKTRYAALLEEGYLANPPDPPPEVSKKGRRKQSPARNLLDRLRTHQDAVLAFLDNFAVPFDNSLAERDIRMVKVQQKVSGCFRSAIGAQAFARIRGYLSTLRKQGIPVLTALEQALVGHPVF